jgi:3-phosphoshikimate 1-carboxyvinyltransferase
MIIQANKYKGHLNAPGSKSHAQRLLLLAALSKNKCIIDQFDNSADNLSMLAALRQFNHELHIEGARVYVEPNHSKSAHVAIQIGESGFALRTLAFVGHCFADSYTLNGTGSLLSRSHWATIHTLETLGLVVQHDDGKLPLQISGTIQNFQLTVDGSSGSQHISGLFMLASQIKGSWEITIENLKSAPYFHWTLAELQQAGFIYDLKDNTYFFNGAQDLQLKDPIIEGDWSSMAAHLVAAAISGSVKVSGLLANSIQADRGLLKILADFGAQIKWEKEIITVEKVKEAKGFHTDINDHPDLFPVLVVLACAASEKSSIQGIHRLQNKESDRLAAMCVALDAWGVKFEIVDDRISIFGNGKLPFAQLRSYNDHRIAMAICIASLLSTEGQEIDELSCLKKSYPGFYEDFLALSKE